MLPGDVRIEERTSRTTGRTVNALVLQTWRDEDADGTVELRRGTSLWATTARRAEWNLSGPRVPEADPSGDELCVDVRFVGAQGTPGPETTICKVPEAVGRSRGCNTADGTVIGAVAAALWLFARRRRARQAGCDGTATVPR